MPAKKKAKASPSDLKEQVSVLARQHKAMPEGFGPEARDAEVNWFFDRLGLPQ
eukprot:gene3259-3771_t